MKDGIERNENSREEPRNTCTPKDNSSSNDQARHGESLREQLQFEQILSELSAAFVNLPSDKVDEEIQTWIQRVGELLGVDLCTVWQVAADGVHYNVTHVCSAAGPASFPPTLSNTAFPWATERLMHGEVVVFSCVDDLPQEAEREKQLIRAIGLKSTVVFPLAVRGSYIGAVTFGTLSHERTWPESLLRRLRLVGEIFANALVLRQSQEAIRRERDRAQQYLNIAGTIMVALDGEQRVTMINEKGCELLGYPEDEIVGRMWFDSFLPPEVCVTVKRRFERLMTGDAEPAACYENPILTKSGEERLIAWKNNLLRDEQGRIVGTLSSGEDITERRRAEKAVSDSEERFRDIYEGSPIAIEIYDHNGRLLDVNKACLEMFGVDSADYVRGFSLLDDPNVPVEERQKLRRGESVRYEEAFDFEKVKAHNLYPTSKSGAIRLDVEIVPLSGEFGNTSVGYLVQIQDITERKKAEEALRHERDRARGYLDTVETIIVALDSEGRITNINRKGCQLLGCGEDELIGQLWFSTCLPQPDGMTNVHPFFSKLIAGEIEAAEYFENPIVSHSGELRQIAWHNALLRDAQGLIIGTLSSGEDITERKRAAEALRESEEKLAKVFQSSPALISISSLDENKFTEVNETFLSTLGFERDQVIGHSTQELNLFVDPETRDEIVRAVREQGFIRHMHVRARTRSGDILDGLLSAESIEVRGHRCLLSVATDITDQRRMERALRESKERFETVAQQSREMVWEVDTNGLFTYVNAACEQVLGYRPDEMIGKMHFYDLHPKEDREKFRRESFKMIVDRSAFRNSVNKVITKDGREAWFLTSGAPLLDESGNLEGYAGADLDITERKVMEEALAAERRLFIGGPTVVFKWRAEEGWPVEYASPNVADQFGYGREEFMSGKLIYAEIVHPDDVQRVADELEASSLAGDTYMEQEYRIVRPDGEDMWVRDYTYLIRDSNATVTHYHGYVLDITQRKLAERELRESEERFLKAFRSSPAMMAISTIEEGRLIEANDVFLTTLGFKRDEAIGRTTSELNVFADPQHRNMIIRTVKEKGFMRNVDGSLRLRSGEVRQCLFSGEIIELSGKKYLLSVVSDITERKRFATMLKYAVEGTSAATGRNFFRSMVKYLATALDMRYALIGEMDESDLNFLTTLAVWAGGKIGKNFQHALANGPCADIFERAICLHPAKVRELFPQADLAAELGVESVLGMPLSDSSGKPLGMLAVMDDKPFSEDMIPHAVSLVSIFAARATAELERLQVEEELRRTTERLKIEREELAEKNIALKQVLGHLEREKTDYKHEISASVENLMMPYIRKLRSGAGQLKTRELDALQDAVESIVGKDIDQFLNNFAKLTPRERDICERIKSGLTSKQIASALNIDVLTVHKHRDAIRRKLQLKHKDLNLTSYLRSR
jgi:PAS domain S-box-containing protein